MASPAANEGRSGIRVGVRIVAASPWSGFFGAMMNLLGDFWLVAAVSTSGCASTGGVQGLIFQGKNGRFNFICCD
jgi:hypothetical protein